MGGNTTDGQGKVNVTKTKNNSHHRMQKHAKTSQNNSKNSSQRKKNTLFLLSRSSKKRCGGAGFTPRVGHRARDSYENLGVVHQSQTSKLTI